MEKQKTEFVAIVAKVQTMADNGLRVVLDLPETAQIQAFEMIAYKINGVALKITATPHNLDEV